MCFEEACRHGVWCLCGECSPTPPVLVRAHLIEALEMAAHGYVSGRLEEWPVLAAAFQALGLPAGLDMGTVEMREQAKRALGAGA